MSVSLEEALNGAGYDFSTVEDCRWLLASKDDFEELCEKCEQVIEESEA